MKLFNLCFLSLCLFCACKEQDKKESLGTPKQIALIGFSSAVSKQSYTETVSALKNALTAAPPITVVAQVNHTANAASVGQKLNNTSVLIFGNPALGTPLMQKNQLAGLDLPQKFLIYEDGNGITRVAFNDPEYLSQRHGLEGVASLTKINEALNEFTGMITDDKVSASKTDVKLAEGIIIKVSANSFDKTYTKLFEAIDGNPNLGIMAEINHQKSATSVDLELLPTRLIIFGNPNLGTPLMQSSQTAGIYLPQKMLVYETADGAVHVAYNNPEFLAERHGLSEVDGQITKITGALDKLSNVAVTE